MEMGSKGKAGVPEKGTGGYFATRVAGDSIFAQGIILNFMRSTYAIKKQIRASPRALLTSLSVCLDEHGIRRLTLLEGLFF